MTAADLLRELPADAVLARVELATADGRPFFDSAITARIINGLLREEILLAGATLVAYRFDPDRLRLVLAGPSLDDLAALAVVFAKRTTFHFRGRFGQDLWAGPPITTPCPDPTAALAELLTDLPLGAHLSGTLLDPLTSNPDRVG